MLAFALFTLVCLKTRNCIFKTLVPVVAVVIPRLKTIEMTLPVTSCMILTAQVPYLYLLLAELEK